MNHMRISIFAVCASLLMVACTGKVPENGAMIQGQATGLDPEEMITAVLFQHEGGVGKGIQIDTLRNGRFSFRLDSLAEADHYMIMLFRPRQGYVDVINYGPEIYLEPGAFVRIKGEGKHFRTARIDSPVKDQKLRQLFLKKMSQEDWNALDEIQAHRNLVVNEFYYGEDLTQEQKDSLRMEAQQDLDASHEISDRLSQQVLKILETEQIGTFALDRILSLAHQVSLGKKEYREAVLRLYERLSNEQKTSRAGMETLNYLNPVKTVSSGSPVPSYEYFDKNGKSVRISDFAGKWVLVDFWSSGCGPCIESIPELGAVSNEFPESLSVISISLDKESVWREASKEHGIFWNDWNDPKGTSGSVRAFGTNGIPTFVIVSPEGIIVDIITGYSEGLLRNKVQIAMNSASE
jgi:thiol-disulfide isomerase/thioredoxin